MDRDQQTQLRYISTSKAEKTIIKKASSKLEAVKYRITFQVKRLFYQAEKWAESSVMGQNLIRIKIRNKLHIEGKRRSYLQHLLDFAKSWRISQQLLILPLSEKELIREESKEAFQFQKHELLREQKLRQKEIVASKFEHHCWTPTREGEMLLQAVQREERASSNVRRQIKQGNSPCPTPDYTLEDANHIIQAILGMEMDHSKFR
jgi:hypothetical protein